MTQKPCKLAPQACPTCRNVEVGKNLREKMRLRGMLPDDESCPWGVEWGATMGPEGQATSARDDVARFRAIWARIHTLPDPSPETLRAILGDLPCGPCRQGAIDYIRDNPPPYHDPAAFRLWAVRWHNAKNVDLGKPLMDEEEALRRWTATQ